MFSTQRGPAITNSTTLRHDSLPVVYSTEYNPFINLDEAVLSRAALPWTINPTKRASIAKLMCDELKIFQDTFHTPPEISTDDLRLVHRSTYLDALNNNPSEVATHFQVPGLQNLNMHELQAGILRPMQLATSGTIRCVDLAFQVGFAINLSGGFHHAKPESGSHYCLYNDLAIAAKKALTYMSVGQKVLIIDLDAHLGDGTAICLNDESNVVIFDIYNDQLPPFNKAEALSRIDYKISIPQKQDGNSYLIGLKDALNSILNKYDIGFILFNAGSDLLHSDPVGNLHFSDRTLVVRDKFIFDTCKQRNIPILITLSGGYGDIAHQPIAGSLCNIIKSTDIYRSLPILISINGIPTTL